MNCANHMDVAATSYCRTCGKAMCASCARNVRGVIYCEECLAARVNDPAMAGAGPVPPVTPGAPIVDMSASPGLAAFLGFIPGVGAMYNGQFKKGFIHVLIFASLVWMADRVDAFGMLVAAWIFYMVFDAYKTAKARKYGQPVPDLLGLNSMIGDPVVATAPSVPGEVPVEGFVEPPRAGSAAPVAAIVLIGMGVLFLLDNLGLMHFGRVAKLWPLILIVVGVQMFLRRRSLARR